MSATSVAVRTIAALTIASAGVNLAKAVREVEKAKDARKAADQERATRRRADPTAARFSMDALMGERTPSLADQVPQEAMAQAVGVVLNLIIGGILNRAATKLGQR